MSSSKTMVTVPTVRFVKCPKCLKILTEFAEIPVYTCGGCGAILRAKARSSSGQNLSTVSVNPGCQNLPDIDPLSNGSASPGQQIPTSDVPRALEQVVLQDLNVSDSNGQSICKESFRYEQHGIKNLKVSDLDSEICEDKWELSGLEGTRIQERTLEQDRLRAIGQLYHMIDEEHLIEGNQAEEGNEERDISLSVKQKANDSSESSNKLEESSETMELVNGNNFRMDTGSSHAYDGSASSTDEDRRGHIPQKYLLYSRRTFQKKNALDSFDGTKAGENFMRKSSNERLTLASSGGNLSSGHVQAIEQEASFASRVFQKNCMETENDGSSSSPTKDAELKAKPRFSEQDHVQILRKVDELKKELSGLFNKEPYHKGSSLFGAKATQFQGKVPPKDCRSSLIAFPMQPNSSNRQCYPETSCCHNEHCSPCPHNVCCHLPEATSLPLHVESSPPVYQDPQNMQFKDFKPQTVMRHCRPVSGGAPFIICCKCFRLLQLPVDFLVLPRRFHKIRCGACSQVLMYSFKPRPHSMTQSPADVQHPPSEENECDVVAVGKTLAPRFKEPTCWDPISISGEYFSMNNSSNFKTSLHMSRSSDDIVEEEQGGSRQLKGLRLHNLMGYASASELLFHRSYSDDGYQSTEPDSSNFYMPAGRRRWDRHHVEQE